MVVTVRSSPKSSDRSFLDFCASVFCRVPAGVSDRVVRWADSSRSLAKVSTMARVVCVAVLPFRMVASM